MQLISLCVCLTVSNCLCNQRHTQFSCQSVQCYTVARIVFDLCCMVVNVPAPNARAYAVVGQPYDLGACAVITWFTWLAVAAIATARRSPVWFIHYFLPLSFAFLCSRCQRRSYRLESRCGHSSEGDGSREPTPFSP